ncbi:MAG TPA: hypothetical protein VIK65_04815 [Candidatus Limnocylindrales bacterium]|jgi:hypothetical protein
MARRSTGAALIAGALVFVLYGCGAAATPIPSAGTAASPAAASAAAESAPGSAAPSTAAAPSEAASSPELPSFAIPSLPSEAKDLEALLPSTLCGAAATKASITGATLSQTVDKTFLDTLSALGKSVNDVSFALAISTSTSCGAGIFRIAGVDPGALQSTMIAQEQKSGEAFTQGNLAGKAVFISSGSGAGKQYVYFHGDAVIFAQAPDDTKAASILQQLP